MPILTPDCGAYAPYDHFLRDLRRGMRASGTGITARREDGYVSWMSADLLLGRGMRQPYEDTALDACGRRVLDVGAGAGRHSLELIRRGHDVTAIDSAAEAAALMHYRGVARVMHTSFLDFSGGPFDTILMLMNGIGIAGDVAGLRSTLERVAVLLALRGRAIVESFAFSNSTNPAHRTYFGRCTGAYAGNALYQYQYAGTTGEPIRWLFAEPQLLARKAAEVGMETRILAREPAGGFLAVLTHAR